MHNNIKPLEFIKNEVKNEKNKMILIFICAERMINKNKSS
jgi:hypothetical protein